MNKILILFFSVAAIAIMGCSKDEENNPSEIKIRLSNISQYDFQNVVVNTTTGDVNFENLKHGQMTEFKDFEKAYTAAFVELEIEGRTYTLQPIDYDFPLLKMGNYTYQINANDTLERYTKLSLKLIKE